MRSRACDVVMIDSLIGVESQIHWPAWHTSSVKSKHSRMSTFVSNIIAGITARPTPNHTHIFHAESQQKAEKAADAESGTRTPAEANGDIKLFFTWT